ncbi:MAG: hypothetical protein ACM3KD_00220, partial [Hyphomicrobiaceae bacterium]
PVFIYGYQDKFKALPGDDTNVALHVTGGTLATTPAGLQGNGVIDGPWYSTAVTDESYLFWQHVRLAGLAPGVTTPGAADYLPRNASGGVIGIQSGSATNPPIIGLDANNQPVPISGTYVICSTNILGKFVKQLDTQLDDGNTATGSMMATPFTPNPSANAQATPTANIKDADSYTVCMGV